jgi:S-adenosylmethionine/arginine decarboxylase-like enzyme
VTAVALLAESHISVHSWPETQTAICDIFTCSEESGAKAAMEHMQAAFKATGVECTTTVTRAGSLFTTPGSSHVEAS